MSDAWARDAEQADAIDDVAGMTREQLTARLTFVAVELTDDSLRELAATAMRLPKRDIGGRAS